MGSEVNEDSELHEIAEIEATPRHGHDRGDGIVQEFHEPSVILPATDTSEVVIETNLNVAQRSDTQREQ